MNVYFPAWVVLTLVVLSAVLAYLQTQTGVVLGPITDLVIGVAQVAVATILGFQRATTNTVRRLRGKPTLS